MDTVAAILAFIGFMLFVGWAIETRIGEKIKDGLLAIYSVPLLIVGGVFKVLTYPFKRLKSNK